MIFKPKRMQCIQYLLWKNGTKFSVKLMWTKCLIKGFMFTDKINISFHRKHLLITFTAWNMDWPVWPVKVLMTHFCFYPGILLFSEQNSRLCPDFSVSAPGLFSSKNAWQEWIKNIPANPVFFSADKSLSIGHKHKVLSINVTQKQSDELSSGMGFISRQEKQ